MNRIFGTFKMNEKMRELQTDDFAYQTVAIIVPTFDAKHRLIQESDQSLYWAQRQNAGKLLLYITSKQEIGSVCILQDGDEANETNRKFDSVIFLHEFVASEQAYITDGLCKNNPNLKVINLY